VKCLTIPTDNPHLDGAAPRDAAKHVPIIE
jgi:hypothetical protein